MHEVRGKDTPNFIKQQFTRNNQMNGGAYTPNGNEQPQDVKDSTFFQRVVENSTIRTKIGLNGEVNLEEPRVNQYAIHQTVNNNFGNVVLVNDQTRAGPNIV
jgi:hypothetical protein